MLDVALHVQHFVDPNKKRERERERERESVCVCVDRQGQLNAHAPLVHTVNTVHNSIPTSTSFSQEHSSHSLYRPVTSIVRSQRIPTTLVAPRKTPVIPTLANTARTTGIIPTQLVNPSAKQLRPSNSCTATQTV